MTNTSGTPVNGMHPLAKARSLARQLIGSFGRTLIDAGQRLAGPNGTDKAKAIATRTSGNTIRSIGKDDSETGSDRFASLTSMIPGVVYQRIVKPDGDIRYTYISEGAQEMFGVSADEILKDPEALFKTYSDDYKAHFRQRLVAASKTLTKWDVEASIVTRDGRIKYTHAIATPEALPDGSVLWTGLILDATRAKLVEEELKAANRSVEAANLAKSMFLANMSHEIRTPMNGVLGMADLLFKTDLSKRQDRLLTTLKHSAKTLLAIINDVLDISRIEAGRFELEKEAFELHGCLEDVIELCATSAYQKGLELNLIVDGELPALVNGDAGRLRQVLVNLIGNAIKFTETGEARIRVTCTAPSGDRAKVTFEVIDTGIGIAPEAKQRLFAPFSQADTSISRRFGGTGLGLAITRHLVQLMGGAIELESDVGKGTKVSFAIPFENVVWAAGTSANDSLPLSGRRVLILDDRESVRTAIHSQLADTGAQIERATSENEALRMLREAAGSDAPFAVAIIDRVRPNFDSLDFCRTLNKDRRFAATSVISIVSINWRPETETPADGARPFITLSKPVRRTDLINAVASSIANETMRMLCAPAISAQHTIEVATVPHLGMRVLLAEDNPVNQEVAREYLSMFGCDVVMAENGVEAIEKLDGAEFDIVLMDCQMPELDGLSATRRIREIEKESGRAAITIVAVTANAFESDRTAAMAAGMNDYLTKPFTEHDLGEMLAKWKGNRGQRAAA